MSTNENAVSNGSINETPTSHADAVQERIRELQRWRELIPRFVTPSTPDETQRLSSAASVSPEFVELTNVAIANHATLVRGGSPTPAQLRDLMSYADAHDPLADELEALAQFVRHSVAVARNTVGAEALTTYALAQRLAKRPENASLAPYVADMRRALGRHNRKLSPEAAAQKAAEKAAKAAERATRAAEKVAKRKPPVVNKQS